MAAVGSVVDVENVLGFVVRVRVVGVGLAVGIVDGLVYELVGGAAIVARELKHEIGAGWLEAGLDDEVGKSMEGVVWVAAF